MSTNRKDVLMDIMAGDTIFYDDDKVFIEEVSFSDMYVGNDGHLYSGISHMLYRREFGGPIMSVGYIIPISIERFHSNHCQKAVCCLLIERCL